MSKKKKKSYKVTKGKRSPPKIGPRRSFTGEIIFVVVVALLLIAFHIYR